MGCGKSSVGRKLSQLLCCPFMDLDQVIEERAGRTIPEIFSQDGEPAFRSMESEILKEIVVASEPRQCVPLAPSHSKAAGPSPYAGVRKCQFHTHASSPKELQSKDSALVVALGGGAVMTAECAEIIRTDTKCIYLRASVDTLIEHLEGQTENRPLLSSASCHSIQDSYCHSDRAKRVEESALRDRITELMAIRSATYENTAHIIIDIDGKSIEAIASEIISRLG